MQIPDSTGPFKQSDLAKVLGLGASGPSQVSREIAKPKNGKLEGFVTTGADGKPKITNLELAAAAWRARTDHTHAPQHAPRPAVETGAPASSVALEPMSIAEGAEAQKFWQAKLAELKFRTAAKELVPTNEIETEWGKRLSEIRSKLLGVPTRVKQSAPHLTVADVVLVENLIREALQSVGSE